MLKHRIQTLVAPLIAIGALLATTSAGAEVVALRADGTAAFIHDPVTGQTLHTLSAGATGGLWSGVVAYDVDPNLPGDELFFTQQLNQAAGSGGVFVYSNQPGSNLIGSSVMSDDYAAITTGQVLGGGTSPGMVVLRQDPSGGNYPVFEIWDPAGTVSGSGRVEFQLGRAANRFWSQNVLAVGELSSANAGDEVMVLRLGNSDTLVEFYGRTGGAGNATYERIDYAYLASSIESFAIADNAGPGGDNVLFFLRQDGRISYYSTGFMTENGVGSTANRYGFTAVESKYENFIKIADVLDSNPGDELIVGYYDETTGVRGYQILSMPDSYDSIGTFNEVTLEVLGTFDLGAEIRDIDVLTIPEPGSIGLLTGGIGLLFARRRQRCLQR